MSDYLKILKIVLKNNYRKNPVYKTKPNEKKSKQIAKKTFGIIFALLGIIALLGYLCYATYSMTVLTFIGGLQIEFLSLIISSVQLVIILFGFNSVLSNLFYAKDNEFLAQLPVKPNTVFSVKMTVVYLSELTLTAIFLIPTLTTYIVTALVYGFSLPVAFYVLIPLIILLTPLIPIMIVTILSFPIIKIKSLMKNRDVLSLVFSILMYVGFMAIYLIVVPNLGSRLSNVQESGIIPESMQNTIVGIGNGIFYNGALANMIFGQKVGINLLIVIATLAVSLLLVYLLSSFLYRKSATKYGEETQKKVKREIKIENKSRKKVLFEKEFKSLFRDKSFAFNSVVNLIIVPLILVFLGVMGNKEGVDPSKPVDLFAENLSQTGFVLFYAILIYGGTNYSSSLAFTRDGPTFYMYRYLPISIHEVINAKANLANILSFSSIILTTVVSWLVLKVYYYNVIPLFFAMCLFVYVFNYIGIFRDLKKPKINWTNAYEAVKRNYYPLINMLYAMVVAIGFMVMGIFLPGAGLKNEIILLIFWSVIFVVGIAMLVTIKLLIKNKAQKYFERINVD